MVAIIYFPLSFLKDIKAYGKFSQIGLIIYFSVVVTIITRSIMIINKGEYPDQDITLYEWNNNILQYVGIFILAYDVNGTVSVVHQSMKEKKKFWIPLLVYITFSCIVGCIIGLAGYFAFRGNISENIFDNIGSLNGGGEALQILYCYTLVISICLYGFVLTRMVDIAVFKKTEEDIREYVPLYQRIFIKLVFFASISILAYVLPSVSTVFHLVGSIFGVILTYILPGILYEKIFSRNKMSAVRIINYVVIAIGTIGGITGFSIELNNLINH